MASGMGMPSIGIYSFELYNFYDVETIIRVGSAGAISPELHLRDVVFGMGACTNSSYAKQFNLPGDFAPIADYGTLCRAVDVAKKMGVKPFVGNFLSSDTFYDDANSLSDWQKMGVLAVEMEAAALYMNAARSGKKALAVCTISDCPLAGGEECTALEREQTFNKMIEIALETADE
jgi:purine-nucleoside phosphorylase